jgi:hypothetical protein
MRPKQVANSIAAMFIAGCLSNVLSTVQAAIIVAADSPPYTGVTTDLFDVSNGTTVMDFSPQNPLAGASDARSIFGFLSGFVTPGEAIFADGGMPGDVDFVTFRTLAPINLVRYELRLQDDSSFSGTANRGVTSVELFASPDGALFDLISSGPITPFYNGAYGFTQITVSDDVSANGMQFFRLEVTRVNDSGPRIVELDGFGSTFPEPGSLMIWSLGGATLILAAWHKRRRSATS